MANNTNNVVKHRIIQQAADKWGVSKRLVQRVWAATKILITQGETVVFKSNKEGVSHQKFFLFDKEKILKINFQKRCSIRSLANELDISKSLVGEWVKHKVIRPHTNTIKPGLTTSNKLQRIEYTLNALRVDPQSKKSLFSEMQNVIHIDEKWFYMSRNTERYYMVPEESDPHRTAQSKRFIPKVMFMCAVSRPIISDEGEVLFDGKIGLWPFTKQEPAQRNSKNRVKGTLVTKPIESITKEVIKACILDQVIPAIQSKWPLGASKHIIIQQDDAKPHISDNDADFRAATTSNEFNIQLKCQPPNSPNTNINDLGWFKVIQSIQIETSSYTVDDLVKNVMLSFQNLSPITLNKVFLSLQACMIEILKSEGNNNYKLPHMGKDRLIREGKLPKVLEVDDMLVRESIQFLKDARGTTVYSQELQDLAEALGY